MTGSATIPEQPNYFWHWILILALVGSGVYFSSRFAFVPPRDASTVRLVNGNADWYMVLKMPEMPSTDGDAVANARVKMSAWLSAMIRAGYQPMLLSDVIAHKKQNVKLPEKAVVLLFDPGYRATYEAYSPVFEKYRVPATWVTHAELLDHGDFRYVSKHLAAVMARSGFWDVALYNNSSSQFFLTTDGESLLPQPLAWAPGANWQSKNGLHEKPVFHRLAVQPQWSAQDLLDQLNVEVPIAAPVYLYVKSVDGRFKALNTLVTSPAVDPTFNFHANSDKRVSTLFWPSTEGQRDFTIDFSVDKIEGELWLFLRSNEKMNTGVRVGVTKELVTVEQDHDGRKKELALHHFVWPAGQSVTCKIVWVDNDFRLQLNGREIVRLALPSEVAPVPESEKFGMMVYDRIRGSGQADRLNLTFSPLTKDLVKIIQSFTTN